MAQAGGFLGQMVVGFHIDAEVLEDVPEDNCRFLMERGMKIFAAGVIRFYHIEVCWRNQSMFPMAVN